MMLAAAASADYTSQSDAQIRSLYGDIEEDYNMMHQYEGELDEYEEEFDTVSSGYVKSSFILTQHT